MTIQEQYIERIKVLVADKFGRQITSIDDCELLDSAIYDEVGIRCDSDIIKELYLTNGQRQRSLRPATLSTLARYVGYSGWSSFCAASEILPAADTDIIPVRRRWGTIILTFAAIAIVITAIALLLRSGVFGSEEKPMPNEGTEQTTSRVDSSLGEVYDMWIAATVEHCNTLREYISTDTQRIESEVAHEIETLRERIAADVVSQNNKHDKPLTEEIMERDIEIIELTCIEIYDSLLSDMSRND